MDSIAMTPLDLANLPPLSGPVLAAIESGGPPIEIGPCPGSSPAIIVATVARHIKGRVVLLVAHLDDVDVRRSELERLLVPVQPFPALEVLPGESSARADFLGERLGTIQALENDQSPLIVTSVHAMMQRIPTVVTPLMKRLSCSDTVALAELTAWLSDAGYDRVPSIEREGEFAIRGGVIDIAIFDGASVRIDLDGEVIDRINQIDMATLGADQSLQHVDILARDLLDTAANDRDPAAVIAKGATVFIDDLAEVTEQGRAYMQRVVDGGAIVHLDDVMREIHDRAARVLLLSHGPPQEGVTLPLEPLETFDPSTAGAMIQLEELTKHSDVLLLCGSTAEAIRGQERLDQRSMTDVTVHLGWMAHGFTVAGGGRNGRDLVIVPNDEMLHRSVAAPRSRHVSAARPLDAFTDVQPGDLIVHRDHGIGRFVDLKEMDDGHGGVEEYLTLQYAGHAKLHVPCARIELVQRYIGAFHGKASLATLGARKWAAQKEKVSEAVRDLATEMLRLQALRRATPGIAATPDTPWQAEFEASFPWQETPDQIDAIAAVKKDMEASGPMDRLICGDVGFGKTEIAIRAAFKAVQGGRQVAILVPTTVLAEQHHQTFCSRLKEYPVKIAALSRFRDAKSQRKILESMESGGIDIVIGTHRLLSKDVAFKDLGLVVIDEEQRFGVEHKQRLLQFRATADVLTLSATPIPRTLHMSMLGLRDISSLTTPPQDRRAVVTEVISWEKDRLRRAIQRELAREGQVFVVHNRVHDLEDIAAQIRSLSPKGARILIGHGQMPPRQLEDVMVQFVHRKADILVCTTIIESGIDIPTANTIIISEADIYGLSDLHQLRGRVGRFRHRAYCYLCLPRTRMVSSIATKRLHAVEQFSMLGAGFRIALRDLELRGAGNLLGAEQSGHISTVGYEMYCQLLERRVQELTSGEPEMEREDVLLDIGPAGVIPRAFIPVSGRRMEAYRRIARAKTVDDLNDVQIEITAAYGKIPSSMQRLIDVAEVRVLAAAAGVTSISLKDRDIVFQSTRAGEVSRRFATYKGRLTVLSAKGAPLEETWVRPRIWPLESSSLLATLRRRLDGER
jgi:transcription-repair coupling factor (superfamily II helicase)